MYTKEKEAGCEHSRDSNARLEQSRQIIAAVALRSVTDFDDRTKH